MWEVSRILAEWIPIGWYANERSNENEIASQVRRHVDESEPQSAFRPQMLGAIILSSRTSKVSKSMGLTRYSLQPASSAV